MPTTISPAIPLVRVADPDGPPLAWTCGTCGNPCREQSAAEMCHRPCEGCGAASLQWQTRCNACFCIHTDERLARDRAESDRREVEHLAALTTVPWEDLAEDVGLSGPGWEAIARVEELEDFCDREEMPVPARFFVHRLIPVQIDMAGIVRDRISEFDNGEEMDPSDEVFAELQVLLDDWLVAHRVMEWKDVGLAVDYPKEGGA